MRKNKSILYVTHSYNTWAKAQIDELAKNFEQVHVLVRHKPIDLLAKIIRIPQLRFFSSEYKINTNDKPENVHIYPLVLWYLPTKGMYRKLGNWHLRSAISMIKKKNIRFDIVHSHIIWTAGWVGLNISKQYKVPFVVTGHGKDVYQYPFKDKVLRRYTLDVLNNADKVITVSQKNLSYIRELGIKRKINVILNGFNSDEYSEKAKEAIRRELSLPLNKNIYIHTANLTRVKCHKELLLAISQKKNELKNSYFIFAGGGELYSTISKEIKKLGLSDIVLMTNFLEHKILSKYQMCSDFGLLPSSFEGMPTVLFEYMACGLPVIASRVGGIPEIINEKNGILIEKENVTQLGEALVDISKKKWNRKGIRETAKLYTWENICKKIMKIYEELV